MALAAFAWAIFAAPFEVEGYDDIARLVNGQRISEAPRAHAVVRAPIWSSPDQQTQARALAQLPADSIASGWVTERPQLATGRLVVLCAVGLAGLLVATRRRG